MSRRILILSLAALLLLLVGAGVSVWWLRPHTIHPTAVSSSPPIELPNPPPLQTEPHPGVRQILQMEQGGKDALEIVESLPDSLSADDCYRLLVFACGPRPGKISEGLWPALANDILNALRRQANCPDQVPVLRSLYRSPATPYILRDYAIQHIGAWLAEPKQVHDPEGARSGMEALLEAACSTEPLAGTALCALLDLLDNRPGFVDATRMDEIVTGLVQNASADKFARITAIQIAAERHLLPLLPVIRNTAADAAADPSLRLSAIAFIGSTGSTGDLALLRQVAAGQDASRYQEALDTATASLSKLSK
jgi:hypothetical protein